MLTPSCWSHTAVSHCSTWLMHLELVRSSLISKKSTIYLKQNSIAELLVTSSLLTLLKAYLHRKFLQQFLCLQFLYSVCGNFFHLEIAIALNLLEI